MITNIGTYDLLNISIKQNINFIIIYRYLAKHLSKKIKCTLCICGLKNNNSEINTNKSEIVEMKTRGFLTHPNGNMYNTLQLIKTSFQKHCSSPDVFENTYNEFLLASTNLKFP